VSVKIRSGTPIEDKFGEARSILLWAADALVCPRTSWHTGAYTTHETLGADFWDNLSTSFDVTLSILSLSVDSAKSFVLFG